MKEKRVERLQ